MQRKNYILNTRLRAHRGGFAMIMAISFLVLMTTIMALSLSLTSKTAKKTTDLYLYEQVVLLSKSAAEYALLEISQAAPCTVSNLNFTQDTIYNINIDISYIYVAEAGVSTSPCDGASGSDYINIITPESNGSVLMDVTVSVEDEDVSTENIRYFRRSIQKL